VVLAPPRGAAADEEAQLALAVALSLSLCDGGAAAPGAPAAPSPAPARRATDVDLSYEALVQLEDVRPVAPPAEVDALPSVAYDAAAHGDGARCAICQEAYAPADAPLLLLPCAHLMHARCGRTYLLRWSKRCPELACRRSVLPWDTHD
jgi:hypothetical protein